MYKKFPFILMMLVTISKTGGQEQFDSCMVFLSPSPGSVITIPACTLQVESECKSLKSVEFQARYYSNEADTPHIATLGKVTHKPFKIVWDISAIPNQYYSGVELIAIGTSSNGKTSVSFRDGIFFLHNPLEKYQAEFPYEYSGTKEITGNSIELPSNRKTVKIDVASYWNEKEIVFILNVTDPLFYANIEREILASMGVEILIDLQNTKKTYPDKNVLMYAIPLFGKPMQVTYKPSIDQNGRFNLETSSEQCELNFSVTKNDFKGFSIYCSLPAVTFGTEIPESLSCNFIAKTLEENNSIRRTSWVKVNHIFEVYSPAIWGTIKYNTKPLSKNRALVFGISFIAGLIIFLFYILLLKLSQKPHKQIKFERNEAEQQLFDQIKTIIEDKMVQKKLSTDIIARELKMTPKKLNMLLKKYTGMSSQMYLMYCRSEVAKERLRSSHWSEVAIAEASGFENASEMEKYFIRFNKMTPFKFRQQQQIS
ncbi:MAG: AraC family transcriptional regulator [Chitinispirillaceae bacterium]|nr:AraC family transcriptional regulator [Chitinispirillaceae bacterium]